MIRVRRRAAAAALTLAACRADSEAAEADSEAEADPEPECEFRLTGIMPDGHHRDSRARTRRAEAAGASCDPSEDHAPAAGLRRGHGAAPRRHAPLSAFPRASAVWLFKFAAASGPGAWAAGALGGHGVHCRSGNHGGTRMPTSGRTRAVVTTKATAY